MKISIINKERIDIFIAIFQLLKGCTSSATLRFDLDKLYIQGMDKAHVCLFDITIHSTSFDKYEMETELIELSVDCNSVIAIISRIQDGNILEIEYDEADPDKLNINLINDENVKGDYNRYFKIPLLDLESDLLEVPDVEYDAEIMISCKKLFDLTSQLIMFGDSLNIKCSEELLELSANGDMGEMKVNIDIDDLKEFAICEGEVINLSYSLNYVHKMCLTNKLVANVELSVSGSYPMRIKYDLGNESNVMFYLAPKVQDD
jgi:proliferating cell nuclear antigen PCNA